MKINKLIPIFLISVSCFSQTVTENFIDDGGIYVEKYDPTKSYDENYNSDNTIYTAGKQFIYFYYYQNSQGQKYLIKKGKEVKHPAGYSTFDWDFVEIEKQDDETILQLILKPDLGNPFKNNPEYNQTSISYYYVMKNGDSFVSETTGAIENMLNVWIHPPRSIFFKILELNPFPNIKSPYEIGSKWNWNLGIGDFWSDERWLKWEGSIVNNIEYEIVDRKNISTKMGDLECYIINATAKSRIGETGLISYFNNDFGFVKLEYTNIDGTKTILELEKVE